MEALNERIPHSVCLRTRLSPPMYEVNCFMFALGIEADAVSDMRLGPVFPGKQFVESLLAKGDLREAEGEGPIVIYFRAGACRPMGWCRGDLEMGGRRDPHLARCLVGYAGILWRRSTLLRGVADRRRALPALGRGRRPLSDVAAMERWSCATTQSKSTSPPVDGVRCQRGPQCQIEAAPARRKLELRTNRQGCSRDADADHQRKALGTRELKKAPSIAHFLKPITVEASATGCTVRFQRLKRLSRAVSYRQAKYQV